MRADMICMFACDHSLNYLIAYVVLMFSLIIVFNLQTTLWLLLPIALYRLYIRLLVLVF
jgi:hypothetical protein